MSSRIYKSCIIACFLSWNSLACAVELNSAPKLQAVADQLIAEEHFTQAELDAIFAQATVQQSVIDAMTSPAEYRLTWGKYRKIFLGDDRIQQGVEFWNEYAADLARAEKEYGVPESIIVSIIGVESKFGRFIGKHKVLDSLVSLVVGYPRRSDFFAKELKQFLILSKENQLELTDVMGSYAGAVGYPQFISSSYRAYAVDFNGDGKADLINDPVDAIGSVANYFIKNGWKPGQAVTSKEHMTIPSELVELANRKRNTKFTAAELRAKGAKIDTSVDDSEPLNVLMLNVSEVVPESDQKGIYVVRAGDTACQVAERHDVTCKALSSLNKLNDKGAIFRGQRLKLPSSGSVTSSSAKPVTDSNSALTSKKTDKSGKWTVSKATESEPLKATIEDVESTSKPRYFYPHHNFYAITKYNHSVLYAMAVYDLSIAIGQAKTTR